MIICPLVSPHLQDNIKTLINLVLDESERGILQENGNTSGIMDIFMLSQFYLIHWNNMFFDFLLTKVFIC